MFTTQFITTPEIVCTINDLLFPIFLFCFIFGLLCYLTYDYEQHEISEEIDSKSDCVEVTKMQSESEIIPAIKEEAMTIVEKDKQAKLLIGLGIRNLRLFCKQRQIQGYSTVYKRGKIKGLANFLLSQGYFYSDIVIALK
ncbi:hypothetical protein IQ247_09215 [Plectonema cf. radiosum LEGE 06105]|uniref:Uncharacterized protein n=1 Tax=Plectonema cf. radiosum LEGE 06105 TaxID=945769 RepID=A0A8J7F3W6_9CYAN|nr:hypothetical protein [Plectonema radiosum]MBE9212870.1 hypothetical protein [Plectonema cf. radiosum LEGE 06105]